MNLYNTFICLRFHIFCGISQYLTERLAAHSISSWGTWIRSSSLGISSSWRAERNTARSPLAISISEQTVRSSLACSSEYREDASWASIGTRRWNISGPKQNSFFSHYIFSTEKWWKLWAIVKWGFIFIIYTWHFRISRIKTNSFDKTGSLQIKVKIF